MPAARRCSGSPADRSTTGAACATGGRAATCEASLFHDVVFDADGKLVDPSAG